MGEAAKDVRLGLELFDGGVGLRPAGLNNSSLHLTTIVITKGEGGAHLGAAAPRQRELLHRAAHALRPRPPLTEHTEVCLSEHAERGASEEHARRRPGGPDRVRARVAPATRP